MNQLLKTISLDEISIPFGNELIQYQKGNLEAIWDTEDWLEAKLMQMLHPDLKENREEIRSAIDTGDLDISSLIKISKDEILENREKTRSDLMRFERQGMQTILDWMDISSAYVQPGASKPKYHGHYLGGLIDHNHHVKSNFETILKLIGAEITFDKPAKGKIIRPDSAIIIPHLHDITKVGKYFFKPLLKETKSSHKWYLGAEPFSVISTYERGHGEESVMYALTLGLSLTGQEMELIRRHMGPYDKEWEGVERRLDAKMSLAYALHVADNLDAKYRK